MKIVRIIKNWNSPDFIRQTPNLSGKWGDVLFTEEEKNSYDYVIVLNYAKKRTIVSCPKGNLWCMVQEPPNEYFKEWHKGEKVFSKVFTTDTSLKGKKYIPSQPALPWHINKTYDELKRSNIFLKKHTLSWITSMKEAFSGHRDRMMFIKFVRQNLSFDLIASLDYLLRDRKKKNRDEMIRQAMGQGYNKIVAEKWQALAPYKYTIVVENYRGPYYWSEKLADAFLSFCLPIYYGCTNLAKFFPKESFIELDIHDSSSLNKIKTITQSNLWEKRIDHIIKARQLILEKYQFFPYMCQYIAKSQWNHNRKNRAKEKFVIPKGNTLSRQIFNKLKRFLFFP